jgi:hypothetical protein
MYKMLETVPDNKGDTTQDMAKSGKLSNFRGANILSARILKKIKFLFTDPDVNLQTIPDKYLPILATAHHWIPFIPFRSRVNPSVAPTTLCVVDTGALTIVARISHELAPPRIAS